MYQQLFVKNPQLFEHEKEQLLTFIEFLNPLLNYSMKAKQI